MAAKVDGDPVPVPHFGAALTVPQFHGLADRLKAAGVSFVIEPHLRFQGKPGEQVNTSVESPIFESVADMVFGAIALPLLRCACHCRLSTCREPRKAGGGRHSIPPVAAQAAAVAVSRRASGYVAAGFAGS